MVFLKALTSNTGADDWFVYHKSLGNTEALFLNKTGVPGTYTYWGDTTPTDSVVTFGPGLEIADWVAYCWAESPTQSFGSYTGNGLNDGPVIDCGFEPAFVMVKSSTVVGTSWNIVDSARGLQSINCTQTWLLLKTIYPGYVEFTSTGFKVTD